MHESVREGYEGNIRMRWNTHSDAIDGNTLTVSDTVLLLTFGKTRGEHLVRENEERQGNAGAFLHM